MVTTAAPRHLRSISLRTQLGAEDHDENTKRIQAEHHENTKRIRRHLPNPRLAPSELLWNISQVPGLRHAGNTLATRLRPLTRESYISYTSCIGYMSCGEQFQGVRLTRLGSNL